MTWLEAVLEVEERFPMPTGSRSSRAGNPSKKRSSAAAVVRKVRHDGGGNGGEFVNSQDPIKVTIKGDRKSFYPPSNGYRRIVSAPPNGITIEWVYGYRGFDTNKNLWVLPKVRMYLARGMKRKRGALILSRLF